MSMRSFISKDWTSGAGVADNSALTTLQYMSLASGAAGQMIMVEEIEISGLAAASAPQNMQFRRSSSAGTGGATALASPNSDGPLSNQTAAITTAPVAAIDYVTLEPTPSNSAAVAKLNLAFNAFGGVLRWNASNTNLKWWMVGNGNNVDATLSNNTGSTSATVSAHILYELP